MDTVSAVSIARHKLFLPDPSGFYPTTMEGIPRVSERIVTFSNSMISFIAHQPTAVNFEACYKTSRSLNHFPGIATTHQGRLGCRQTFLFIDLVD